MSKWEPIETAPRGERILVTYSPSKTKAPIHLAWFSNKLLKHGEFPWKMQGGRKLRYRPTHWMPLPATPEKP